MHIWLGHIQLRASSRPQLSEFLARLIMARVRIREIFGCSHRRCSHVDRCCPSLQHWEGILVIPARAKYSPTVAAAMTEAQWSRRSSWPAPQPSRRQGVHPLSQSVTPPPALLPAVKWRWKEALVSESAWCWSDLCWLWGTWPCTCPLQMRGT